MPIEQIDLNSHSPIIFRHPNIRRKLIIGTGVSGMSWPYELNTVQQSTYGGEVGQVLSAYVGALTVHGQTTDNRQLRQIADWFLEYMQLAGLHNRDEHFITMEYPERGWSFWIQVTSLPNFHYNIEELAIEWSITAEIVADNDLNYLSQMTMSAYTETAFDPSMWDMKFMAHDKRNDPIHLDPSLGLKIGDNFQSLLGAWATGDFAHWAFDATADVSKNNLKSSREYWTQIFGSDTPFASSTGGGAGGSGPIGSVLGSSSALNSDQNAFASGVASGTGLSFTVMAAWVTVEGNGGGDHNWLNTSTTTSGKSWSGVPEASNQSGQFSSFQNVQDAIRETNHWINTFPNYHGIHASAGKSDQEQLRAIWESKWDEGHYGGNGQNLINAYNRVKGTVSTPASGRLGAGGTVKARQAAQWALTQLGKPYVWGAESPGVGFDCSGLTEWAYSKVGVSIPRTAALQQNFCHSVPRSGLQVGDLMFLGNPAYHVVMYIGNGKVVAAPARGRDVQIEDASLFGSGGQGRVPNA